MAPASNSTHTGSASSAHDNSLASPKTVVITGSSRNIGLDLARAFLRRGDNVIVNARSQESVTSALETLGIGWADRIMAHAADVRDDVAVQRLVDEAQEKYGAIDILVNNAALRLLRPLVETDLAEWSAVVSVILDGAFNCTRAVLPGMIDNQWGRIINIASLSGLAGAANRASLVAGKSGLVGFTKAVALEVAALGVTVNAVAPGMIDTERGPWTDLGDEQDVMERYRRRMDLIPMGRMGTTTEVVTTCLFLASDDASYITGQTISVNGGLYM